MSNKLKTSERLHKLAGDIGFAAGPGEARFHQAALLRAIADAEVSALEAERDALVAALNEAAGHLRGYGRTFSHPNFTDRHGDGPRCLQSKRWTTQGIQPIGPGAWLVSSSITACRKSRSVLPANCTTKASVPTRTWTFPMRGTRTRWPTTVALKSRG